MTFHSLHDSEHLYFLTASIIGWKDVLSIPIYRKIVLDSLVWLRKEKRMYLYAFVIMPNHLHLILKPINKSIGQLLQEFGSFTAHTILKELRKEKRMKLLSFFHEQRRDPRHQHSIWQDIQAKNIFSQKVLEQKMEYIHQNPLRKGWNLVKNRADYPYSSACFYDNDENPIIEVDDVRNIL
ncbi:MAG: transposase [Chloroflexi bacterium]|nr:transposase [Chloroflexota bacterium]